MLVKENDPVLKTLCSSVSFHDMDQTARQVLVDKMTAAMIEKNGLGLAASQIGVAKRLFILNVENTIVCCFNPEIVEQSGDTVVDYEGCLSFPDLWLKVDRSTSVVGRYLDIDGELVERKFEGVLARCFLHELDHVNGVVFVEKVGQVSLAMAQKRRTKQQRQNKK